MTFIYNGVVCTVTVQTMHTMHYKSHVPDQDLLYGGVPRNYGKGG